MEKPYSLYNNATVLISVLAVVAVVDVVTVSFSGSVEGSVIVDSRWRTLECQWHATVCASSIYSSYSNTNGHNLRILLINRHMSYIVTADQIVSMTINRACAS